MIKPHVRLLDDAGQQRQLIIKLRRCPKFTSAFTTAKNTPSLLEFA